MGQKRKDLSEDSSKKKFAHSDAQILASNLACEKIESHNEQFKSKLRNEHFPIDIHTEANPFRPPSDLLPPLDFVVLASKYPNLSKYVHKTRAGTPAIDFRNAKALRELSSAVLFLSSRLGYVCWTEHLVRLNCGSSTAEDLVNAIDM
ncbi:hypothetical protein HK100_002734 [Physocladia obscura]|uniref:Uncharacterized protein n=1 Tax=Physocladia obscura TaxID=109957 RepID=A0AAD5XA14_9FUNG|nr:hypothetical protein HK100_002734 [Physocladia obscura]